MKARTGPGSAGAAKDGWGRSAAANATRLARAEERRRRIIGEVLSMAWGARGTEGEGA